MGALFRSEAPEMQHVTTMAWRRRIIGELHAMMNDGHAMERRFELELTLADGNVVHFGMRAIDARQCFFAMMMERVDDRNAEIAREAQPHRGVDLNGVEPHSVARNFLQAPAQVRQLDRLGRRPIGLVKASAQLSRKLGVAGRKKCDFVASLEKGLSEVTTEEIGPAIALGRNTNERG